MQNDYPLVTEKLGIGSIMFSRYCSDIADQYGIKVGGVNEFVRNLDNKSKYVLHYRNLRLYLLLGMKWISVHRILRFKQFYWLQKYIDLIPVKKNAFNSFEKYFLS